MTSKSHHQPDCPGLIALIATARCPVRIDCTMAIPPSGFIVFHAYSRILQFVSSSFSMILFPENNKWLNHRGRQKASVAISNNHHFHNGFVKIGFSQSIGLCGDNKDLKSSNRDVFWMPECFLFTQLAGSGISGRGDKGAFGRDMYIFGPFRGVSNV